MLLTTLLKPSGQGLLPQAMIGQAPGHAPLPFSPALLRDPRSNRQGAESEATLETKREWGGESEPEAGSDVVGRAVRPLSVYGAGEGGRSPCVLALAPSPAAN